MKDYVKKAFPELESIKDEKLKQGVIDAWTDAMEMGGWKKLDHIPFTLLIDDPSASLLAHTRTVTQQAMAVANVRDDLDMDLVIAGGLLHDVGKLLEYDETNGKIVKSRFGALVRHPVSGASLAMKHGLPDEITHMIAAHSKEGEMVKRIPEAILINHCDFIDFEIAKTKT